MAQQHLDPTDPAAARPSPPDPGRAGGAATGDALAGYLRAQATEFLRALRLHRETGSGQNGTEESVDAARALRHSARRISGSLHTFRPLLDSDWSEEMRPELAWLSGTLALEHACAARLERLLLALHRLSGSAAFPAQSAASAVGGRVTGAGRGIPAPAGARAPGTGPATTPTATAERGNLTVGAAKAGALLERQLTLARTRAHSTALQALGSSRFHAVADKVAVLASEVPLTPAAATADLRPLATAAGNASPTRSPHCRWSPPGTPTTPRPSSTASPPTRPRTPRTAPGTRSGCCCGCTATPVRCCTGTALRRTYACWRPARPSICTGTPRRPPRRPRRPPVPRGSPRRPRTRSACSTPTSATRWRRPASPSSSRGRNRRWAPLTACTNPRGGDGERPVTSTNDTTVQAAGCVLWRRPAAGDLELALVHRPKWADWSWPKGKLKRGETFEEAARREVLEETGYTCRLGTRLPRPSTSTTTGARKRSATGRRRRPAAPSHRTTRSTRCAG